MLTFDKFREFLSISDTKKKDNISNGMAVDNLFFDIRPIPKKMLPPLLFSSKLRFSQLITRGSFSNNFCKLSFNMVLGEGFEPSYTIRSRILQTRAIDHSATPAKKTKIPFEHQIFLVSKGDF